MRTNDPVSINDEKYENKISVKKEEDFVEKGTEKKAEKNWVLVLPIITIVISILTVIITNSSRNNAKKGNSAVLHASSKAVSQLKASFHRKVSEGQVFADITNVIYYLNQESYKNNVIEYSWNVSLDIDLLNYIEKYKCIENHSLSSVLYSLSLLENMYNGKNSSTIADRIKLPTVTSFMKRCSHSLNAIDISFSVLESLLRFNDSEEVFMGKLSTIASFSKMEDFSEYEADVLVFFIKYLSIGNALTINDSKIVCKLSTLAERSNVELNTELKKACQFINKQANCSV